MEMESTLSAPFVSPGSARAQPAGPSTATPWAQAGALGNPLHIDEDMIEANTDSTMEDCGKSKGEALGSPTPKNLFGVARDIYANNNNNTYAPHASAGPSDRPNTQKTPRKQPNSLNHVDDDSAPELTAEACGFNPDGLSDDEKGLLPSGADEKTYARVRNRVLSIWRSNVSRRLELSDAISFFDQGNAPYALAAWMFLNALGYINFGVSPDFQKAVSSAIDTLGTVVVLGAGCAGLATARQLRSRGYRVVLVEGRSRPGGRVHTTRMTGPKNTAGSCAQAVADLGGSILTGIDGNPLAVITKQIGLPLVHIRDETPLFMPDGTPADPDLDSLVEDHYNNVLMTDCDGMRSQPGETALLPLGTALESLWRLHYNPMAAQFPNGLQDAKAARQLFDWHLANLEFANASLLKDTSLVHWDQDDPNELPGAHCFVPGCNGRWLHKLVDGLAIFYDSPVDQIRYCKSGVAVHTPNRVFHADAVVVTCPLGVLKKGGIRFNPPLSERKNEAIARLGFGKLNKVIMLFPRAFWGKESDMFGHVSSSPELRGEAFLFYSYDGISGGAQLTALVSGAAAAAQEERPPGESAARVMTVLRGIFEPQGVIVPAPLQVIVTAWGSDPMTYGAYSSIPVGAEGGKDYDTLGESIGDRVFFAGEATTRRYPASMHGAFYSGLWTAAHVDASFRAAKMRKEVVAKTSKSLENTTTPAAASISALPAREDAFGSILNPPPRNHGKEGGAGYVELSLKISVKLQVLFEDPQYPPDLKFGSFAAVWGPENSSHANFALFRFSFRTFGTAAQDHLNKLGMQNRGASASNFLPLDLYTYLIIPKSMALELSKLPAHALEMRIAALATTSNVCMQFGVGRERKLPRDVVTLASIVLQKRRDNAHRP